MRPQVSSPESYMLPDLHAVCPLSNTINPHIETVGPEATDWFEAFGLFKDRKRAWLVICSLEKLAAHAYPDAGAEQLRTCADFILWLFAFDEVSDAQTEAQASAAGRAFLDALKEEPFDMAYEQITRLSSSLGPRLKFPGAASRKRFFDACEPYIDVCVVTCPGHVLMQLQAVGKEARNRERGEVLEPEAYTKLRRESSAVRACILLFEYVQGVELPENVWAHDGIQRMINAAIDLVCYSNDIYSYDMEQAKGVDGHNIVTVLMRHLKLPLQDAMAEAGRRFAGIMRAFFADKHALPSFGAPDVDARVALLARAMEQWVIGNLDWSFESQRYFGPAHEEVRRTLRVQLSPRDARVNIRADNEPALDVAAGGAPAPAPAPRGASPVPRLRRSASNLRASAKRLSARVRQASVHILHFVHLDKRLRI